MKYLFKVTIVSIALMLSLSACNEPSSQPQAQQQAAQESAPPAKTLTMHDAVTEVHRDLMDRMSADCDNRGIAGAKECWVAKLSTMSYNVTRDKIAMRAQAKNYDPAFSKEVEFFVGPQGPVADCNKVAGLVPKKIVFCRAFELAYINTAVQWYEAGAWKPENNEQFEGD